MVNRIFNYNSFNSSSIFNWFMMVLSLIFVSLYSTFRFVLDIVATLVRWEKFFYCVLINCHNNYSVQFWATEQCTYGVVCVVSINGHFVAWRLEKIKVHFLHVLWYTYFRCVLNVFHIVWWCVNCFSFFFFVVVILFTKRTPLTLNMY